jgi:hypothetical protein
MAEFWEETIQLLQPPGGSRQLVNKPQLKPELLQKIPFKFLHDVMVSVRAACLLDSTWNLSLGPARHSSGTTWFRC